jgi:FkbM family methyltransferase
VKYAYGWAFPACDEFMVNELKPDGTYQVSHLNAAMKYVTDWSVACDGGSHIGTWTRLLSTKFARVIAVEPSADTYEALVANMVTFGCTNVEALNVALGQVAGHVSMAPLEPRAEALKNTGARFVAEGGSIERITIDSLKLPSLGFLKLDIEGSEPLALLGARETLARCKPVVLYENKGLWRRFGMKPESVTQILSKSGYRQLERAGCDVIWGQV